MRWQIPMLILCLISGCRTHLSLQDHTLKTAATLADLNYQQVLDNVARFVCNAGTLPSVAVVNSGQVLITDQGSFGGAGTYTPTITAMQQLGGFPIFNVLANPNVSHSLTENWSMVPVTDINKVRRLRGAFQLLVGAVEAPDYEDCLKSLEGFIPSEQEKLHLAIPTGWYCVGGKSDVPKEACYVGQFQQTYVWVLPHGVEAMSRFTMTIMQLSTSERNTTPTKTVVQKFNAADELEWTEIYSEEPDDESTDGEGLSESGGHLWINQQPTKSRKLRGFSGMTPKQTAVTPKQARKRPGVPNHKPGP